MYISIFLMDFLNFQTGCAIGDSYEIRSDRSGEPFRLRTGRARPVRASADRISIGSEVIESTGWVYKRQHGSDPIDEWTKLSDHCYRIVIKYFGLTPPDGGIGYYNLILPSGWHFQHPIVTNRYHYQIADYQVAVDEASDREALRLDFTGPRADFEISAQVGTEPFQIQYSLEKTFKATIVEPNWQ